MMKNDLLDLELSLKTVWRTAKKNDVEGVDHAVANVNWNAYNQSTAYQKTFLDQWIKAFNTPIVQLKNRC